MSTTPERQTFSLDNQTYDFNALPEQTKQLVVNLGQTDACLERHQQESTILLIAREQLVRDLKAALVGVPTVSA